MQISVSSSGKEVGFKLVRLNYASAHVRMKPGTPDIVLLAGGTSHAPRERATAADGLDRLIWVFPPEWTNAFPDRLEFQSVSAKTILAQASGSHGLTRISDPAWPDAAAMADCETHRAPFPANLVRQVNSLAQTRFNPAAEWDAATVTGFVAELKFIRQFTKRVGYANPLARYLGYLQRMDTAVQYALRHFPDINTTAMRAARYHAIATHPDEMMTIIHHLYVLRAAGVGGDLAEFGCFKGFSTSCLSRACAELHMPMHVFDSFQGLPASTSGRYLTGEYSASFDEVRQHVADFGMTEAIEWHQGFFSQTLESFDRPIACIWMDVDLMESARDVMAALPLLDSRGCIFSHELSEAAFVGGQPNQKAVAAGRFEVLGPIAEAVEARAGAVRGEHLGHSLGVIYLPDSIQVLSHSHVRDLLALAD